MFNMHPSLLRDRDVFEIYPGVPLRLLPILLRSMVCNSHCENSTGYDAGLAMPW